MLSFGNSHSLSLNPGPQPGSLRRDRRRSPAHRMARRTCSNHATKCYHTGELVDLDAAIDETREFADRLETSGARAQVFAGSRDDLALSIDSVFAFVVAVCDPARYARSRQSES